MNTKQRERHARHIATLKKVSLKVGRYWIQPMNGCQYPAPDLSSDDWAWWHVLVEIKGGDLAEIHSCDDLWKVLNTIGLSKKAERERVKADLFKLLSRIYTKDGVEAIWNKYVWVDDRPPWK